VDLLLSHSYGPPGQLPSTSGAETLLTPNVALASRLGKKAEQKAFDAILLF